MSALGHMQTYAAQLGMSAMANSGHEVILTCASIGSLSFQHIVSRERAANALE
jgi:hypothetical protein